MVTVDYLRAHLASVLGRVEKGERVEVTKRGRVIAVLTPPMDNPKDAKLAGVARDLARRVAKIEEER